MKNMELMGTERMLESVLREYAKKSCPDEMQAYLNGIPEPKLSMLIEAMEPETIARFEEWARNPEALEIFKSGPSNEVDRIKGDGPFTTYELIRRFEELQDEVDHEIMKFELWLAANPLAKARPYAALAV